MLDQQSSDFSMLTFQTHHFNSFLSTKFDFFHFFEICQITWKIKWNSFKKHWFLIRFGLHLVKKCTSKKNIFETGCKLLPKTHSISKIRNIVYQKACRSTQLSKMLTSNYTGEWIPLKILQILTKIYQFNIYTRIHSYKTKNKFLSIDWLL